MTSGAKAFRILLSWTVLLWGTCGPSWVHAGEGGEGKFKELTLAIDVGQKTFLPFEPVPVNVLLVNKTARPIEAPSHLDRELVGWKFLVAPAQGQFLEFPGVSSEASDLWSSTQRLFPDGRLMVLEALYYGRPKGSEKSRYIFERSGQYRVKVALTSPDGKGVLESNEVVIRVEEPQGEDAQAMAFLKSVSQPKFLLLSDIPMPPELMRKRPDLSERLSKLEEFCGGHSKSRYASFAQFSLGLIYSRSSSVEEREKGLGLLEKVVQDGNCFLVDRDAQEVLKILADSGRLEAAKNVFTRLVPRVNSVRDRSLAANAVMSGARKKLGACKVRVSFKADEETLKEWKASPHVALAMEWKDIGYIPEIGLDLMMPGHTKGGAITWSVPPGKYRISICADHSSMPECAGKPLGGVVVVPEVIVKGDMEITVEVTRDQLNQLKQQLEAKNGK
jgi:hypothetical protein